MYLKEVCTIHLSALQTFEKPSCFGPGAVSARYL